MHRRHFIARTRSHHRSRPLLGEGRRGAGRRPATAALVAFLTVLMLGFAGVQTASAQRQSVTFGCTGFPQEFNVPPGATQLTVSVRGAAGAGDLGGRGGLSTGLLNVTPGDMLRITVGCRGGRGLFFVQEEGYGFARGGDGGSNGGLSSDGDNGGGASAIADDATGSPLIVAGGGGGQGGRGFFYTAPSGGQAPDGDGGPGGPAGVGAPGQGGGSSAPAGGTGGEAETASSGGGGGGGGGGYPHGGGGGGGGGVGGTAGGGGGGGNSFAGSSVVSAFHRTAADREDGEVTIGYVGPPEGPEIFECTGAAESYTVPAGVASLSVVAAGAAGGSGPGFGGPR